MQHDQERGGVPDIAPQWKQQGPADAIGYDSNYYGLRRYLKRAATLDNFISAVEQGNNMHREAREDWMTRLG